MDSFQLVLLFPFVLFLSVLVLFAIAVFFLLFVVFLSLSFSSFFFLSSSFFIISRVAGLSAGPGRGDEVFLSCFPLGVSLGAFSDGYFSCFF